MIDIKDIQGNTRFSTSFKEGAIGKFSLMKEDYVVLPFNTPSPIDFQIGDYVDLRGVLDASMGGKLAKIYDIVDISYPKYNTSTGGYDYELRLDAYYFKWKTKIFKYTPEVGGQEASWSLTAPLNVQMGVFLRNLKALGYKYEGKDFVFSIDSSVENSSKLMTYDNTNLIDAMFSMADQWGCDCWVTDHVVNFGRCEFSDAVTIELNKEAKEMSRSNSKGTYATRIYAFGSTRNIPTNYRPVDQTTVVNGIVQRRLMLPEGTPYVDAREGLTDLEAIETVVVFDDIYPRRVGTITDVSSYESEVDNEDGTKTKATFYRFKESGINFSKEYIIEGQELKIKFESGKLNGMEFGIAFNPLGLTEKNDDGTWNPDAQLWEIVLNEDYGRPLPDEVLLPKIGDTYVLSGWNAEKITELGLVTTAEQELLAAAKKYVAKTCIDDGTYTATLNSIWVHGDQINHSFDIGQRINLVNPAYFTDRRLSRVIGFEIKLDLPYDSPQYTIGESTAYSRISDIETQVEELTFKGQTFTGSGGSNIYVIKTNDSTAASNFNVFSALRTLRMFLRKNAPDAAEEIITFLKGLLIGKNGSGITVREDGTSQAVVDRLYVKIKAVFEELQVKKATHVGGEQIISHAGMKCIRVEELEDVYRCYFLAEQEGEAIANEFSVGSLAQAKECNIVDGTTLNASNRYYWREVMEVGRDYIDLSKTIYDEGSDVPLAGDDIIGLGHRKDVDLQSAIVLSSTNETSPSIVFYAGIDDFNLTEKDIISFGLDKSTGHAYMRVYGTSYIGARDESTYIKYTPDSGVEIKGKFLSATTGKNIENELGNLGADVDDMRNVTDKIVIVWFEEYIPTLTNLPASEWTDDDTKKTHGQDLFYNTSKDPAIGGGRAYRWEVVNGVYGWKEITDKDTIAALEAAAEAQKIAKGKRRTFLRQPTDDDEYDAGDIWVNATWTDGEIEYDNDSLVCITTKEAGVAFSISHWRPSTKITSSYIKQMEDKIEAAVLVTAEDSNGNIISTNKNGLVLTTDFSSLMSSYADEAGIVSKAEISTFISDDNGNFTSNAVIRADKIDFIGKTMINGKFVVDTDGHVTMTDFTANSGVFNGTVNATDGTFNGTVNATSGSFQNVTVRNINNPGDPFYVDALGYLHTRGIEVDDAVISGDITATNAIFKYGEFQHGVFENITFKKSINTPEDNLYIDAAGAVTVNGTVNATSGIFENITLKNNINTPEDNLYIDASGAVTVKGTINATSGSFENITLNKNINTPEDNLYVDATGSVTLKGTINAIRGELAGWEIDTDSIHKNNIFLGADGSIYNSNGTWYLGNDNPGYLAGGNISWDGNGDITTNNITVNSGTIGGFKITGSSIQSAENAYDGGSGVNGYSGSSFALYAGGYSSAFLCFKSSQKWVGIGLNCLPAGTQQAMGRFEDSESDDYTFSKTGLYISISGAPTYDDPGFHGNSALYIPKGHISGYRRRLRRVNSSMTLSVMDSILICKNAGEITVTLPSGAEDGQEFWLISVNRKRVNVVAPSGDTITASGETFSTDRWHVYVYDAFSRLWLYSYMNYN